MKRSKRLYFSSTELMEYLKEGRKKSNAEIEQEAEAYLSNNKKGLNNGKNQKNNPNAFQHKRQGKDTDFKSQLKTIFHIYKTHCHSLNGFSCNWNTSKEYLQVQT